MKQTYAKIWIVCLLCALFYSAEAQADAKLDRTVRNIESALANCDVDQYWDGSAIKPGTPPQALHSWLRSCKSNLNRAIGYYNGLTPQERNSSEVTSRGIKERLQKAVAFGKAAEGSQQTSKVNEQQMLEQCRSFKTVRMSKEMSQMGPLVQLYKNPNAQTAWAQNVEGITAVKNAALAAQKACADHPEFAQLDDRICSRIYGADGAAAWCQAAGKVQELLPKAVMNHMLISVEHLENHRLGISDPKNLDKKEGWLSVEGPVEYKKHLYFSEAAQKEFLGKYEKLFTAAGASQLDPALIEKMTKMRDELRKRVDELAPGYSMPPHSSAGHYSTDLARKKIQRWHPSAKVLKAVVVRNEYSIYKNELGVPKYRDRGGYILFQLPGEPWCQLRSFVASEDYQGGGSYQKTSDVMINSVRFQSCK